MNIDRDGHCNYTSDVWLRSKDIRVIEVNSQITEDITQEELKQIMMDTVKKIRKELQADTDPYRPSKKDKIRGDILQRKPDSWIATKYGLTERRVRQIKDQLKEELPSVFED